MGQQASVPVPAAAAVGERHPLAQHQVLERLLGLGGERPGPESGPAEGQLGRLDADQAHLFAGNTLQDHRVPVHHPCHQGAGVGCPHPGGDEDKRDDEA